jgi:hypothetical protein
MVAISDRERQLLEKLATEGKPTRLTDEDMLIAKALEEAGLVFLVRNTLDAIITPKGRHILSGKEAPKPGKKPGYFD